ncbi:hypothetical protein [Sulfuracidifex metallicus]|uniref:hypothetical protein n=1 Tax=Sulfuracidifex metallicus TaxID=47303 RepID=UPI002275FDAE|nr:hypothetical protein [Sulfuracidifex metallicus]MCY0849927.1 hypothetical protein [Sulfuracidifex metallicus]
MFKVVSKEKRENGILLKIKFPVEPEAGQFVTILNDGKEIPLGIYDYVAGTLHLIIEKGDFRYNWAYIKGPLGKGIDLTKFNEIIGVAQAGLEHDIHYPLVKAERMGIRTRLLDFIPTYVPGDALLIISLPKEKINTISRDILSRSLIYVRWVKMNCSVGVCGVCSYRGYLPCIEGPFMEGEKIVA